MGLCYLLQISLRASPATNSSPENPTARQMRWSCGSLIFSGCGRKRVIIIYVGTIGYSRVAFLATYEHPSPYVWIQLPAFPELPSSAKAQG